MNAKQAINKCYNGHRNPITPNLVEYWTIGDLAVEISWGEGIFQRHAKMYGVTVVTMDGERTGLSEGGFSSEGKAREYVETLRYQEI